MPNISLGLEIKADGIPQTVGELKKAQAAIAAMKREAAAFSEVGKALGITDAEAKKLAQSLGKTADETLDLVRAMKDLKVLGADAATRFQLLGKAVGVNAKEFEKLERSIGTGADELSDFQRVSAAIAGAGIATGITQIGRSIFQTGLETERLKTQLETALGKEGAQLTYDRLNSLAARTPLETGALTQAFISLRQRGIEPTNDVLIKAGDIAQSQGKSLQQFTEAILDASTGENERLKEFGITAQTAGNQVKFSFQGVNKTVEKTPQAIAAALLSFGELKGVAGSMEAQSQKLGGQLSTLSDNVKQLGNQTFDLASGPAIALVGTANNLLNTFASLPDPIRLSLLGVTAFSGAIVTAIAAVSAYNIANGAMIAGKVKDAAVTVLQVAPTNALTAAKFLAATATQKFTIATLASASASTKAAVASGVLAASVFAIAAVVTTYQDTTKAASELEAKSTDVKAALVGLAEVQTRNADATKKAAAAQDLQKAAFERTQDSIGGLQQALDVVRGAIKNIPGLGFIKTANEESIRRQQVALEELADQGLDVLGKGYEVLGKKNKATAEEVKAATSAVNASLSALESSQVTDQRDADIKAERIRALQKLKAKLDENAKAEENRAKAVQAAAQKEAEALKQSREESKTQSSEQFEERNRDRQDKFTERQRDRQEDFNTQEQVRTEAFNKTQQTAEERFQSIQNQAQERFQSQQQSDQAQFQAAQNQAAEQFQTRQQARQQQFEEQLSQRRERTATAFTQASQRASQAEQLASAQTTEERAKLAAEFKRQAQQQQAVSKLQLADREFNPDQILKLAQKVSGANLATAEGAQKVQGAIQAIQAQQQRQQEAADQQAKVAFEKQLQAEKVTFEAQQQESSKVFQAQQQESSKAFQVQQRQNQQAFQELQNQIQKSFDESERQTQKAFEESERIIARSHEDEGRTIQKAFNERERQLDQENAEAVKKILESAKAQGGVQVQARRSGGPVAPGEPYLVGEEGPELIIPRSPGQVMTARETAALMRVGSPNINVNPSPKNDAQTQKLMLQQIELLRYQNDHLRAIASRRPAGTVNQTTVINEYNTRSSRGLPR